MPVTEDTQLYNDRVTVHFHAGRHYYTVSVPEFDIYRVYQPGVTTILKIKDKSGPLCWWTAEQCELYGKQKIAELQEQMPGVEGLPVDQVIKILGDMRNEYRDAKRRAAEIGTTVHSFLHRYLEAKQRGAADEVYRPTLDDMPEGATPEMCEKANAAISAGLEWFSNHKLVPLRMESPVWSPENGFIGTDDFVGYVDGELCVCDYKTSKDLYPEVWLQTAAYQQAYQEEFPHLRIEARWGINTGKDGQLKAVRRERRYWDEDFKAFMSAKRLNDWDRVHAQGKEAFEVIGALPVTDGSDWLEELSAEAA